MTGRCTVIIQRRKQLCLFERRYVGSINIAEKLQITLVVEGEIMNDSLIRKQGNENQKQ